MTLLIGSPIDPSSITVDLQDSDLADLSEQVFRELVAPDGQLALPWSLALLVADISDAEDEQLYDLYRASPPWLGKRDLDLLGDIVQEVDLPSATDLTLKARSIGVAGRTGFALVTEWLDTRGHVLDPPPQVAGGIISTTLGRARLSFGQHETLRHTPPAGALGCNRVSDLAAQAAFSSASPESDPRIALDQSLLRNQAKLVSRIQPQLSQIAPDTYEARPQADGITDTILQPYYKHTEPSEFGKQPIVAREGRARVRYALDENSAQALQDLRKVPVLDRNDVARVLSHPEQYFGTHVDHSELGERVVGLGPEIKRSYPSYREAQTGDWWDWDVSIEIDQADLDTTSAQADVSRISLKDPEQRDALRVALEIADAEENTIIPNPFGEGFLPITDGLRSALARADTHASVAAEKDAEDTDEKEERQVLQVLENVEDLEFDRSESRRVAQLQLGPPPGLQGQLFPYQQEGYQWLVSLYTSDDSNTESWRGAMLADDMGLGKTLQVLSLLAWVRNQQKEGASLLVAPAGLLHNWQNEAMKFFGTLLEPVIQVQGKDLPADVSVAAIRLGSQNLVLVSYETLRAKEAIFARVPWNLVILDEGQKAKEPTTQIARVLRTLKANFRLVMTGTPVENSLKDLWTLFDWATPGLLSSLRSFVNTYMKPLDTEEVSVQEEIALKLYGAIGPVFLRRMKKDHVEGLKPIEHKTIKAPLSPEQERAYTAILRDESIVPLAKLTRLFSVCSMPSQSGSADQPQESSYPRGDELFKLLDSIRSRGEKVIIFAKWKKLQRWLQSALKSRYGISIGLINGDVNNARRRVEMIEKFSETLGFNSLILAPRAAGVGLNITAANHVIHFTREWNPAVENQATDRAYRVGQYLPVSVYYFIGTSQMGTTVEQKLDTLLEEKRKLMNAFVIPLGGFDIHERDFTSNSVE